MLYPKKDKIEEGVHGLCFVLLSKNQKVGFEGTLPSCNLNARSGHWQCLCGQPSLLWGPRKLERWGRAYLYSAGFCPGSSLSLYPQDCFTFQAQFQVVETTPKMGSDLRELGGLSVLKFCSIDSTSCQGSPTCPLYQTPKLNPRPLLAPVPHSPSLVNPFWISLQAFSVPGAKALVQATSLSPLDSTSLLICLTQNHRPPHTCQDDLSKVTLSLLRGYPPSLSSPVEVPDQTASPPWSLCIHSENIYWAPNMCQILC